MTRDILIIIVGALLTLTWLQASNLQALETRVTELQQDQSWSSSQLNTCLGQIKAYDKAFDYHVVLSELGLYPAIKEEIYLNKKEKGGKE